MSNRKDRFLLIFDLDGTICNSILDIKEVLNSVMLELNLEEFSTEQVRKMIGSGFHFLINQAIAKQDVLSRTRIESEDLMKLFEKKYFEILGLAENTKVYEGIVDLLEDLLQYKKSNKNLKISILTNKKEKATKVLLEKLDLNKYFDFVAGDGTFAERKPHPLTVTETIKALDCSLENTFIVGDGLNDVLVAKNSGIKCIWVGYGYTKLEEIQDFTPEYKVKTVADLRKLIFNDILL